MHSWLFTGLFVSATAKLATSQSEFVVGFVQFVGPYAANPEEDDALAVRQNPVGPSLLVA